MESSLTQISGTSYSSYYCLSIHVIVIIIIIIVFGVPIFLYFGKLRFCILEWKSDFKILKYSILDIT